MCSVNLPIDQLTYWSRNIQIDIIDIVTALARHPFPGWYNLGYAGQMGSLRLYVIDVSGEVLELLVGGSEYHNLRYFIAAIVAQRLDHYFVENTSLDQRESINEATREILFGAIHKQH